MITVTIASKYQIVIPKKIREKLKLIPAQKLQAIQTVHGISYLIPKNVKYYKGILKEINTRIERGKDRI